MNTVWASIYLYLLHFLSSVSYNFPCTGFLHPWLGLFLGIFILFLAVVNEIIFSIPLSVSSLLAHKNATEFWILILYSTTLLNSFISLSSFLVDSLGFSVYSSCHLQIQFYFSFSPLYSPLPCTCLPPCSLPLVRVHGSSI